MGSLVQEALAAASRKDWETLRLRLHPHVRWTLPSGRVVVGRNIVLAMLAKSSSLKQPASHQVRDGQIYRWTASRDAAGPRVASDD